MRRSKESFRSRCVCTIRVLLTSLRSRADVASDAAAADSRADAAADERNEVDAKAELPILDTTAAGE